MYKHWDVGRPRPMEADAIALLRGQGARLFDAATLLRLFKTNEYAGRQRIARLTERGFLTRVRSGLYRFNDPTHTAPPAVTPADLLSACAPGAVLAYETAMAAHSLGTLAQPTRLKVFSEELSKPRALGAEWAVAPLGSVEERHAVSMDIPGFGTARVTGPEQTILDGLVRPRRVAGGVVQVARFLGHMRGRLDVGWMVDRALQPGAFPVVHRLGLLLEMSRDAKPEHLSLLRENLLEQYRVLDPSAPRSAVRLRYWMLEVNVPFEELASALGVPWPPEE